MKLLLLVVSSAVVEEDAVMMVEELIVICYTPPPLADRREESQSMDGVGSNDCNGVGSNDDMYRLSLAERSRGKLMISSLPSNSVFSEAFLRRAPRAKLRLLTNSAVTIVMFSLIQVVAFWDFRWTNFHWHRCIKAVAFWDLRRNYHHLFVASSWY